MATISVPLSSELEERLDQLVDDGSGSSRADVMRRALERFAEDEAVRKVREAQQEPTLHGDLCDLMEKLS